jgi:hypothetical protein
VGHDVVSWTVRRITSTQTAYREGLDRGGIKGWRSWGLLSLQLHITHAYTPLLNEDSTQVNWAPQSTLTSLNFRFFFSLADEVIA